MDQTSLLLSGLVDVRDRHLRVLSGIDAAILVASPGPRQFLSLHRESVGERLREYLSSCKATLEAMAAMGEDGWSDQSLLADLANQAAIHFVSLAASHIELTGYLPPSSRTREDLSYLLFRAGGLSLLSRSHERLVSIIVERNVQWSSRSDEGAISAVAVSVPWLETLTPLRWPLAVHELGHYLLPGGHPIPPVIDNLQDEHGWEEAERDAFAEILADAIAEKYCGPAYAQALAREGYLVSHGLNKRRQDAPGAESVSVKKRLELLACPEMPTEALPAAWNLGPRGVETTGERITNDVTSEMRSIALQLLEGEASGPDQDCIDRAAVLMDLPEPVASLTPLMDARWPERLVAILTGEQVPDRVEAMDLIELVVQHALTDAEIFSAAWRNEVGKSREAYVSALTADVQTDQGLADAINEVATRDTWLAQSLQSAAVHRWLDDGRRLKETHATV